MNKELKEILELMGGVNEIYDQLNDKILFNLRNKTVEQLKNELREDPTEVLQHVYDIAFSAEQYEVCEAVKQLQAAHTGVPFDTHHSF